VLRMVHFRELVINSAKETDQIQKGQSMSREDKWENIARLIYNVVSTLFKAPQLRFSPAEIGDWGRDELKKNSKRCGSSLKSREGNG